MTLSRMWAATLTRTGESAETDSQIELIVNQDGIDAVDHTFSDTAQDDQENGQANLYEFAVGGGNSLPTNLNNSSIRMAIRGDDAWHPENIVVWGERAGNGAIVPLAAEMDIDRWLSTDVKEGKSSIPIRLVGLGTAAMPIRRFLMLMTTADEDDAGTDSGIELQISNSTAVLVSYSVPDTEQSDQEQAQANMYVFDAGSNMTGRRIAGSQVKLRIKGSDAWHPKSFFLFGLDTASGRPTQMLPLVSIPNWNLGWLSTDSNEGHSEVTLPLL